MPTAFSKISIGISRNLRLNFRDRFDNNVCFRDEIIKPPSGDGVAAGIDDNSSFNEIDSTYAPICSGCDRSSTGQGLRFSTKDRNHR